MGRILGALMGLVTYSCVATLLAVGATLAYLRLSDTLTDDTVQKIVAVLEGAELFDPNREVPQKPKSEDSEQPSYEDREQARDLQARNLELREQALNSRLDLVRAEQRALVADKERHERLKEAFTNQLTALREGTTSSGRENVRMIWENIKPKQAKEQILQMLAAQEINEVVALLSAMPIDRRAKIVGEFKTPDEAAKLEEILRLIREGIPEINLVEKTLNQAQP
jgi:hypothetical protein